MGQYLNTHAAKKLQNLDPEDFRKLLEFWKKVYLRKSREETCDDGEDI